MGRRPGTWMPPFSRRTLPCAPTATGLPRAHSAHSFSSHPSPCISTSPTSTAYTSSPSSNRAPRRLLRHPSSPLLRPFRRLYLGYVTAGDDTLACTQYAQPPATAQNGEWVPVDEGLASGGLGHPICSRFFFFFFLSVFVYASPSCPLSRCGDTKAHCNLPRRRRESSRCGTANTAARGRGALET